MKAPAGRSIFRVPFSSPAIWSVAIPLLANWLAAAATITPAPATKSENKVSYYRDIRPILQANCQGCHQPAKAKGGFVMTSFKGLLAGGETEGTAITPE